MASINTSIEWTDATWSPVRGCSIVSKGCTNCYAMKQAHRFSGAGKPYEGLTTLTNGGPVWTGDVRLVPELLDAPLRWRKPRRVFVNSMSDLFHEDVADAFIDQVFGVMSLTTRHTYQILTKRPARMCEYIRSRTAMAMDEQCREPGQLMGTPDCISDVAVEARYRTNDRGYDNCGPLWPLENVWLGVSVEDQDAADERIPLLLETPAAVRFVSAEPLLGPVEFKYAMPWRVNDGRLGRSVDWVIIGGESGAGARPCDVQWIRSIVQQCQAASVPVFLTQLGARPRNWCAARLFAPDEDYDDDYCDSYDSGEGGDCGSRCVLLRDRKGADPSEWPADLRVREMPA